MSKVNSFSNTTPQNNGLFITILVKTHFLQQVYLSRLLLTVSKDFTPVVQFIWSKEQTSISLFPFASHCLHWSKSVDFGGTGPKSSNTSSNKSPRWISAEGVKGHWLACSRSVSACRKDWLWMLQSNSCNYVQSVDNQGLAERLLAHKHSKRKKASRATDGRNISVAEKKKMI